MKKNYTYVTYKTHTPGMDTPKIRQALQRSMQLIKPKYRNRAVGGYSSTKEARRAQELKLLAKAGKIANLREQVPFTLVPSQRRPDGKAERPVIYYADFVYEEQPKASYDPWQLVVEDVKGMRTKDYVIKRKLMLRVHGIAIRET